MKKLLVIVLLLGLAAGLFACVEKEKEEEDETEPWQAELAAKYPFTYRAGGVTIRYYVENGMAFVDTESTWTPDGDSDGTFIVPAAIDGLPVRWAWDDADDEEVVLRKLHCTELIVSAGVRAVNMDLSSAEVVRLGPDVESFAVSRGAVDRIEVDPASRHLSGIDGVLFSKDGTVLLQYPTGSQAERYVLPGSATEFGSWAIWFTRPVALREVVVPPGVTAFPASLDELINTVGYQLTFVAAPGSAAQAWFTEQAQSEAYTSAMEESGVEPFLLRIEEFAE